MDVIGCSVATAHGRRQLDRVGKARPVQEAGSAMRLGGDHQIHVQIVVTCTFKYFQKEVASQIPSTEVNTTTNGKNNCNHLWSQNGPRFSARCPSPVFFNATESKSLVIIFVIFKHEGLLKDFAPYILSIH